MGDVRKFGPKVKNGIENGSFMGEAAKLPGLDWSQESWESCPNWNRCEVVEVGNGTVGQFRDHPVDVRAEEHHLMVVRI